MQMCPICDKVYDESEYSHCPYCSGELEEDDEEIRHFRGHFVGVADLPEPTVANEAQQQ